MKHMKCKHGGERVREEIRACDATTATMACALRRGMTKQWQGEDLAIRVV